MKRVMLDLETLGNTNNSVIISIGAVFFDKDGIDPETFYLRVDPESCVKAGMEMSTSTVMWWFKQSDAARAEFTKPRYTIDAVLQDFTAWLKKDNDPDIQVWGNGATFDNVILSNAYEKCGLEKSWPYGGDSCYRTLKNLYPDIKLERSGTHHNALDDARTQALHCIRLLNKAGVL